KGRSTSVRPATLRNIRLVATFHPRRWDVTSHGRGREWPRLFRAKGAGSRGHAQLERPNGRIEPCRHQRPAQSWPRQRGLIQRWRRWGGRRGPDLWGEGAKKEVGAGATLIWERRASSTA